MELIRNARFPVSVTTFPNLQSHGRDDEASPNATSRGGWQPELAAGLAASVSPEGERLRISKLRKKDVAALKFQSSADHRVLSMDLATNAIAYRGSPALVRAFRKLRHRTHLQYW